MEVESMITNTPSHGAFFTGGRSLIGLTLDAQVHDVIAANGAIVNDNVCKQKRKQQKQFGHLLVGIGMGMR